MKYVIACLACLMITGCASGRGLLSEIPEASFEKFEYHRAGNITSAHISATRSRVTSDTVEIDEVKIQADYGPAVNFNLTIEGYRRARVKTDKSPE